MADRKGHLITEAVLSFQAPQTLSSLTGHTLAGGSCWRCWDTGISVQLTNHGPGVEISHGHQDGRTNKFMEFGVTGAWGSSLSVITGQGLEHLRTQRLVLTDHQLCSPEEVLDIMALSTLATPTWLAPSQALVL